MQLIAAIGVTMTVLASPLAAQPAPLEKPDIALTFRGSAWPSLASC